MPKGLQFRAWFWQVYTRARDALVSILKPAGRWGFTLIGVASLAVLTRSGDLANLRNVRDLQLAVGALVGTILALGLSLSLIPLQRAAESYSPSILRLFREDRQLWAAFIGLLAICFSCFGMVVLPSLGIDPAATVPVVLLLLAISLDVLRHLYRLITCLLEPQEAVRRLSQDAQRRLRRIHKTLLRAAEISWRSLPTEEQEKYKREQHLALYYEKSSAQDEFIRIRSVEFAEIAQKAIARNDWSLALSTLGAMRQLAVDAIERRKSALIFYHAGFMLTKATAEKPLDRIYEDILAVNRTAVRHGAENVSMIAIRALGRIAEHMVTVRRPEPRLQDSAPLVANPISYCRSAVQEAMAKGMDDAGYEGAATLARISHATPSNTRVRDVHAFVMEGIFEVLNRFALSPGKAVHLTEPLSRGLEVLHGLVERKDSCAGAVTRDFLSKLEALVPSGLVLEATDPMALARHPIAPPYDPSSNHSLLVLLQRSRNLIEPTPQTGDAPSWTKFVGFVETICDHFRNLTDNPALASSALMFSLNATVRQILLLLLDESRRARRANSTSLDELERKAGGLIWFYGSAA